MTKPSGDASEAAYQRLIDAGCELTRKSGLYQRLLQSGTHAPDAPPMNAALRQHNRAFNALLDQLTESQRQLVAKLVADERITAIHEWFAKLEWLITCHGYAVFKDGEQVDTNVYWDMTHDFSQRLEGCLWPDEPGDGKRILRWVPNLEADQVRED
ncbi:MAG: DUF6547 family protein [Hyphomicrobium sp.]